MFKNTKTYQELCKINCSQETLLKIKERYKTQINSVRRMSYINSIKDLLNILEKRDCVNDGKLQILEEITKIVNDVSGDSLKITIENDMVKTILQKRDEIHDLIANDIGHKWLPFARALKFTEAQIDDLNCIHRRIVDRVYDVLRQHQYKYRLDLNQWRDQLLQALSSARRNDLKRYIHKLLNNEPVADHLNLKAHYKLVHYEDLPSKYKAL